MAGWMLDKNDPARQEIAKRAVQLAEDRNMYGDPDSGAHALGKVTLADGKIVNAHVVHAVDPVITDGNEIVMINRTREPGKGKPALPGGFIDPSKGGTETAVQAAAREAMEEAGVKLGDGKPVGKRNMNRPFDVRVATFDVDAPDITAAEKEKRQKSKDDMKAKYGIEEGDIFIFSTQAVRFDVPDLANTKLEAGDDAEPGSARRVEIASLSIDNVGIPDHFEMIKETFPEKFPNRTKGKSYVDATTKKDFGIA
jgi:ADP-ribose pyrophosphatase YjhB (NUDIX family)